ncbi:MAG TPA: PAS domain S-box protein [Candidatus Dormibacteraeota bacterium]|nr:PAS domain S-box protein [Candidatus Dormibacteraeota bacterium]
MESSPGPPPVSLSEAACGLSPETLLDAAAVGVVVCDEGGRLLFLNREIESLSGYAAAELLGRHVEVLVPPALRAGHEAHRGAHRAAGSPARALDSVHNLRLCRKDGREVPVDISLGPVPTRQGTMVVAAVRDATGRRRHLQEARERAQLLELAQECILLRRFDDSRIQFWNQGAADTYGFSRAEAVGRRSHALLRTVFPESEQAVDRALARTGRWEGHVRHRRRDGAQLVVSSRQALVRDERGAPVSILETNRDVTEHWRSRALIEASYEVTRTVMAGPGDDRVLGVAAARARELVGAETAAIAVGSPEDTELVIEAADGPDADAVRGQRVPVAGSLCGRVLREGRRIGIEDARAARMRFWKGTGRSGAAVLIPAVAANRRLGVLMLRRKVPFTDVECADLEQLAAAAAFAIDYARVREELERVTLLKERERIARDMHDGAIQSLFHVGLMLRWQAAHAADPEVGEWSNTAADDIDGVIGELRSYIFSLRPELVGAGRLEAALRRLVSTVRSESETDATLEFDRRLGHGLGGIEAEMQKLVAEALSNVVRHARARACRVRLVRQADRALIEVEDDGRGFDTRKLGGAGQGLRNLDERARSLGGAVEIDSAPGEGTAVRISIPVGGTAPRRPAAARSSPRRRPDRVSA